MDPAALVGIAVAFGAIMTSLILEGSSPMAIFLIPALILVFVGSFGAGLAGSTMPDFIATLTALPRFLTAKIGKPDDAVASIVSLAERARREGLLALEEAAKAVEDPFLKRGLELAIDGTDPDEVADILSAQIAAKSRQDKVYAKLFTDMGGYSPTIGIIGTVIGLIHVLENLSEPEKLGELIAGAFVATLWGVLSANIFWLPIASRIKKVSELECAGMELVLEGILAIQAGSNPRNVGQKLRALLPPGSASAEAKKAA